jgi:hypothetical protein
MCQNQDRQPRPTSGGAEVEQPAGRRLTDEQTNFAKVVGTLLAARWAELHAQTHDKRDMR